MLRGYRPDIDGLRAIAVLAVICFHAGVDVPGGYVGVDVFFVISGYLITGLLVRELTDGDFSMARFWERRIRRIWPASLAVAAATLVGGWFWMLPEDYRALGADAIAQVAMLANVRYWLGTDYFAPAVETRPLLHTWSLAVEEQYYVVFPLLLSAMWRFGRRRIAASLCALLLLSFVACVIALNLPGRWNSGAFYLLPFRAWELLLGGVLAVMPLNRLTNPLVSAALALTGSAMMIGCMFSYSRTTLFPGVAASWPCFGAAMVIAAGSGRQNFINRILASRPFRFVGIISYSLYLWHWPILALARYRWGLELSTNGIALCLAVTFGISVLSFFLIESPLRHGFRSFRPLGVVGVAFVATIAVAGFGASLRFSGGAPWRIPGEIVGFSKSTGFPRQWGIEVRDPVDVTVPLGHHPELGDPCFVLWGDSHGMAISETVDRAASERLLVGAASLRLGRPPIFGAWGPRGHDPDAAADGRFDRRFLEWLRSRRPRHLLLCARWSMYVSDGMPDMGDRRLIACIGEAAATMNGARRTMMQCLHRVVDVCGEWHGQVWVLLETPYQTRSGADRAKEAFYSGSSICLIGVSRAEHETRTKEFRSLVHDIDDPRLHIVDLAEPFFAPDGLSRMGRPGRSWYSDDDHINPIGAKEVLSPLIEGLMDRIASDCVRDMSQPPSAGGR